MEHARITSLQVAEKAGVSQSAVSRVFTPGASASAKTIAKVRKAAEELGYRPNRVARTMITGKSRIIGLVVAYLENQFYPQALEHLSNALQAKGYHVLVFTATNSPEKVEEVMRDLLDFQVDGIITASVAVTSDLTVRCNAAGIPVVMFNRGQDGADVNAVTSDNVNGGRKVAEFLLKCGHTHIAHISGWEGSSTGRDRRQGFVEGLETHGYRPLQIIDGMYNRDTAAQATHDLMTAPTPPDAIFVGNDHMAFAVMDTLRYGLGLKIPQDVAIVGFDDVPLAAWPSYDLTTVRQPLNRMVEATVEMMIAQIDEGVVAPRRVAFDGPLIRRSSTRQAKGHKT
ncbi:MAG: LacI family DNA-binding transcriptional regulator [Pseudomonadota bacterium]